MRVRSWDWRTASCPPARVVDPDGRDGCRAPIPWTADGDDEVGHGWPVSPWLPFPANASTHAAAAQVGESQSMHSLYRELLALRREHAVLRRGASSSRRPMARSSGSTAGSTTTA